MKISELSIKPKHGEILKADKNSSTDDEGFRMIESIIDRRYKRKLRFVKYFLLAAVPLFAGSLWVSGKASDPDTSSFFDHIAAITIVFFLLWIYTVFSWMTDSSADKHPVMQALAKNPGDIVWVYDDGHPVLFNLVRWRWIVFGMSSGRFYKVYAHREEEVELIIDYLLWKCARATFGYTDERKMAFRDDPASLLQRTGLPQD